MAPTHDYQFRGWPLTRGLAEALRGTADLLGARRLWRQGTSFCSACSRVAASLGVLVITSTSLPLVLKGARQTGKTHILKRFGEKEFSRLVYLDLQKDPGLHAIFDGDLTPARVVEAIEFATGTPLNTQADLLFLDEAQECSRALTSLKYFSEQMPELAVCAAGSLLGVTHPESPFPVGKVTFLQLNPMSFEEFLLAIGEQQAYEVLVKTTGPGPLGALYHRRLLELLREYFVVGGMPEVVAAYASQRKQKLTAFGTARSLQRDLLMAFISDFAKYSGKVNATAITSTFESIPGQLARVNKKFRASAAVKGGRFSRLSGAIDWLVGAGLALKVKIANSGELPFSAFTNDNRFKLYLFDTGLLGALARLSPAAIYQATEPFATFRGAFCENYVAQEFIYSGCDALYAWSGNTAEVEFLREVEGEVCPVEVKAGLSGKLKSLAIFAQRYPIRHRVRISARDLEINHQSGMHSYPLYLTHRFPLA
jgi:hypothetical protein